LVSEGVVGLVERARESRLKRPASVRLGLDPDQLAREQRIDEATVDASWRGRPGPTVSAQWSRRGGGLPPRWSGS
jgi:hypothetical protein